MSLGRRIKLLRALHDISQAELARRVETDGASLSNIEADRRRPRAKLLNELASALLVDTEALENDAACVRAIALELGLDWSPPQSAEPVVPPTTSSLTPEAIEDRLRAEMDAKIQALREEIKESLPAPRGASARAPLQKPRDGCGGGKGN